MRDLHILFFNFFTCAEVLAEYFYSANNSSLVPLIADEIEEDHFADESDGHHMSYHLM